MHRMQVQTVPRAVAWSRHGARAVVEDEAVAEAMGMNREREREREMDEMEARGEGEKVQGGMESTDARWMHHTVVLL